MQLAYGTGAMPDEDLNKALPKLKSMGYESVELDVRPDSPTAPARMNEARRTRTLALLRSLGFPPPVLHAAIPVCAAATERSAMIAEFRRLCGLARDLSFGDGLPVICSTLGETTLDWGNNQAEIIDMTEELAEEAGSEDVLLALAPAPDTPIPTAEGMAVLISQIQGEHLALTFELSHALIDDLDVDELLTITAPWIAHVHIKEGYRDIQGDVHYLLPGESEFDYPSFVADLAANDYRGAICVDVHPQVLARKGYDPWEAAEFCYETVSEAREVAAMFG